MTQIDLNQHDRFVVTRRRRTTVTPTLADVDIYEFALADAEPFCHVRQRVARSNVRIGFYAEEACTVALMYLDMRPRFDPWARCELVDTSLRTIGEIRKELVPRRRRSHYILYGGDGEEVAHVEAHVPAAVGRRRAGRVAVGAVAGVLGIPFIGAAGVRRDDLARGTQTPVPWESPTRVCEVDMRADPSRLVDRRLVLAVPVALDTLRGVLAESALR